MVLALAVACGTQDAVPSQPLTGSSAKPTEGYCPQIAGVAAPSPCVSVGVVQEQQANQTFNSRIPLSAAVAAKAAPLTQRIQQSLDKLTSAQRLQAPAVRAALLAGGLLSTDLVVISGPPYTSVTFGGYELLSTRPAVCAWGTVSPNSVEVDSGGITREGACLPSAGGH